MGRDRVRVRGPSRAFRRHRPTRGGARRPRRRRLSRRPAAAAEPTLRSRLRSRRRSPSGRHSPNHPPKRRSDNLLLYPLSRRSLRRPRLRRRPISTAPLARPAPPRQQMGRLPHSSSSSSSKGTRSPGCEGERIRPRRRGDRTTPRRMRSRRTRPSGRGSRAPGLGSAQVGAWIPVFQRRVHARRRRRRPLSRLRCRPRRLRQGRLLTRHWDRAFRGGLKRHRRRPRPRGRRCPGRDTAPGRVARRLRAISPTQRRARSRAI